VLKECVKQDLHGLSNGAAKSLIDMHSIHIYTAAKDPVMNITAPRSAERAIQITSALIDLARIENKVPPSVPRQTICFDEWNVWDPARAPGEQGAEERYTLSDALSVALWLNVFIRQSAHVSMANIAQSVNVISPLLTTPTGIIKQTTYYPLYLYSKYMRGTTIALNVACGEYEGPTKPQWIRGTIETPWLDCSTCVAEDGTVRLAVVNVHPEKDIPAKIGCAGNKKLKEVFRVSGDDLEAVNDEENPGRVTIKRGEGTTLEDAGVLFPKHSLTILIWDA